MSTVDRQAALREEIRCLPKTQALLSIQQLSELWGIKLSWIYQHISELPHRKIGNLVRFVPSELEAYLENNRRGPTVKS